MKFLSIDPSMTNTGIAVGRIDNGEILVDHIELLETPKANKKVKILAFSDTINRNRKTYKFIHGALDKYQPDVVFVELPTGSQSSAAAKGTGCVCMLIASIATPPIQVTAEEVKVIFMNDKKASKRSIINKATSLYPDLPWEWNEKKQQWKDKNEHMSDAIAITYAGIQTDQFKQLQHLNR